MRRFGEYDVLARLTASGPTAVYVARKRGAGRFARMACLKTYRLPSAEGEEDEQLLAFVREAAAVTQLRHDACVRVSDVGTQDGISYIAMEYLVGETLEEVLARARASNTPVPFELVAAIVARAADGLHYAHERDLVHRDLCPSNVMITYEGAVKVLDVGLSGIEDHIATRTGQVAGRPAYLAPEQLLGHLVDRRSDVFALGVVLHEAFGNHQRYAGIPAHELALRTFEEPPPIGAMVPNLPRALGAITDRALATDPARRYATADDLSVALNDYLAEASYRDGTNELSQYMRDTFWDRARKKQRVVQALIEREDAIDALLDVLGAAPPTPLDFPRTTEPFDALEVAAPTVRATTPVEAAIAATAGAKGGPSVETIASGAAAPVRNVRAPSAGALASGASAPGRDERAVDAGSAGARDEDDWSPDTEVSGSQARTASAPRVRRISTPRERAPTKVTPPLTSPVAPTSTPQISPSVASKFGAPATSPRADTAERGPAAAPRRVFGYPTRIVYSVLFGVVAGLAAGLVISFYLAT